MRSISPAGRAVRVAAVFLPLFATAACTSSMLAARVDRELGVSRYAHVPADSVRVVWIVRGPAWRASLDDTLAAPYEELASIETLGVGHDAAADALAALRRRVGEAGGNVALVSDVHKDPMPPYTRATGYALRALPPMPDAAAHCASLAAAPDSAGFRVAICREAARVAPDDPAPVRDLAFAYLTLYERGVAQRKPGLALQSARSNAQFTMRRAADMAPEFATPAPWIAGEVRLAGGDSLRAFRDLGWLLEGAGSVEGALAAFQEVIRLAPDSADGYDNAFTMLLRLHRAGDALRTASTFARRHPERVEGWARAGVAANVMGDHVLAMRFFGRVLAIDRKYFGMHWESPYGIGEYRGSEQRVGKQPPATVADLP